MEDPIRNGLNKLRSDAQTSDFSTFTQQFSFKADLEIIKDERRLQLLERQENLIAELSRFSKAVDDGGKETARLTHEILQENKKLGHYTLALAFATFVLAAATVWMGWSTQQLAAHETVKPIHLELQQ